MRTKKPKKRTWRTYADSGFVTAPLFMLVLVAIATMLVVMVQARATRIKILAVQDSLAAATLAGAIPDPAHFANGEGLYIPSTSVNTSYDKFVECLKTNLSLQPKNGSTYTFTSSTANATMQDITVNEYIVYSVIPNSTTSGAQTYNIEEFNYSPVSRTFTTQTHYNAIAFNTSTVKLESRVPSGEASVVESPNGKAIIETSIYAKVTPKFATAISLLSKSGHSNGVAKIDDPVAKVSSIVNDYTTCIVFIGTQPGVVAGEDAYKEQVVQSYYVSAYNAEDPSAQSNSATTQIHKIPISPSGSDSTALNMVQSAMQECMTLANSSLPTPPDGFAIDTSTSGSYGWDKTCDEILDAIKNGTSRIEVKTKWKCTLTPAPGENIVAIYNEDGKSSFRAANTVDGKVSVNATSTLADGSTFKYWSPDKHGTTGVVSYTRTGSIDVDGNTTIWAIYTR